MNPTPPDALQVCLIDRMELLAALKALIRTAAAYYLDPYSAHLRGELIEAVQHAKHTVRLYGSVKPASVSDDALPKSPGAQGGEKP